MDKTNRHLKALGLTGGDFMPGMIDLDTHGGGLLSLDDKSNSGNMIPLVGSGNGVLDLMGGSLEKHIFEKLGGGIITLTSNKQGGAIRMPMEYFGLVSDNYHADGGSGEESSFSPYESPGYQYCGLVGGTKKRDVFTQKDLLRLSKKTKIDLPKDKKLKMVLLREMNTCLRNILYKAKAMSKSGKITRKELDKIMREKK